MSHIFTDVFSMKSASRHCGLPIRLLDALKIYSLISKIVTDLEILLRSRPQCFFKSKSNAWKYVLPETDLREEQRYSYSFPVHVLAYPEIVCNVTNPCSYDFEKIFQMLLSVHQLLKHTEKMTQKSISKKKKKKCELTGLRFFK